MQGLTALASPTPHIPTAVITQRKDIDQGHGTDATEQPDFKQPRDAPSGTEDHKHPTNTAQAPQMYALACTCMCLCKPAVSPNLT